MKNKYGELLLTWCDTMEKHIVSGLCDSNLDGGILCPACHRIHGRCADSLPAFLFLARETGEEHYRESGERIFDWSEHNMKREDGSLYNDSNSFWRGITVFSLNSLALALEECEKLGIHGKQTTPYLLDKIQKLTKGQSLEANIQLVYNNARLASKIATSLAELKEKNK